MSLSDMQALAAYHRTQAAAHLLAAHLSAEHGDAARAQQEHADAEQHQRWADVLDDAAHGFTNAPETLRQQRL